MTHTLSLSLFLLLHLSFLQLKKIQLQMFSTKSNPLFVPLLLKTFIYDSFSSYSSLHLSHSLTRNGKDITPDVTLIFATVDVFFF